MKKFLKYLGVLVAVLILLVISGTILGKFGIADDKLLLTRFQDDSKKFWNENGNFSNFCTSNLYTQLKSKYAYDVSCTEGQSNDGSDLQIVAGFPTGNYGCRVATFPPVNSKTQKAITCIQLPEKIGNILQ